MKRLRNKYLTLNLLIIEYQVGGKLKDHLVQPFLAKEQSKNPIFWWLWG